MDWIPVITALIASGIPAVVTIVTNKSNKVESEKQSKRSIILALITMDKVAVLEGKLPQNAILIHRQYDEYVKIGGNSFINDSIREYDDWVKKLKVERRLECQKQQ